MRVIKRSLRSRPRVSLILADWGVRESYHLLHYLKDQTVPREAFEVVLIEYYGAVSEAARKFESEIDTWILLEMPTDCYYHKHLMYNTGVVLSNGELLMFMDSDAMVRPTFVEAIVRAFERDPSIVYHMDEFRNTRRDFYPFNYPSFEDVAGDGCINNAGGKTTGIVQGANPSLSPLDQIGELMHIRNSGAAMCAKRQDVIAIGGADEDLTYLGHICGPYDMTFRLMNSGRHLVWESDEYLYHTWHPGSDGIDNYLGPHDGRNFSTTALQALSSGQVQPLIENEAIQRLRTEGQTRDMGWAVANLLIDTNYVKAFDRTKLARPAPMVVAAGSSDLMFASYHGFNIFRLNGLFYAAIQDSGPPDLESPEWHEDERWLAGSSFAEICDVIDGFVTRLVETIGPCNICQVGRHFVVVRHELGIVDFRVQSHRENPGLVWLASLAEAREAANLIVDAFDRTKLAGPAPMVVAAGSSNLVPASYRGHDIYRLNGLFYAVPQDSGPPDLESGDWRENERIVKGASFTEVCHAIDAFDARLLEAIGACNICQVGKHFVVVRHELGTIDFQIRSQRENPGLVWLRSLAEAREAANLLALAASPSEERQTDQAPTPNQPAPPASSTGSDFTGFTCEVASLQPRIAAVEKDVLRFRSSRTWRARIWLGGILQAVAKALRLGKVGPN